jgi:hypothetical protein
MARKALLMKDNSKMSTASLEATDLERRVLAHEKVLQTLIAYMATNDRRFIDHFRARFVEPMRMARHEHDHREPDDYAEEFVRAAILLAEVQALKAKESDAAGKRSVVTKSRVEKRSPIERSNRPDGVQVQERNGIWEVRVDGKFRGDYCQKEHALAAANLHRLSFR